MDISFFEENAKKFVHFVCWISHCWQFFQHFGHICIEPKVFEWFPKWNKWKIHLWSEQSTLRQTIFETHFETYWASMVDLSSSEYQVKNHFTMKLNKLFVLSNFIQLFCGHNVIILVLGHRHCVMLGNVWVSTTVEYFTLDTWFGCECVARNQMISIIESSMFEYQHFICTFSNYFGNAVNFDRLTLLFVWQIFSSLKCIHCPSSRFHFTLPENW